MQSRFVNIIQHVSDPIDLFMTWCNMDRSHMSLDWDNLETSIQAFAKKISKLGTIVIDSQTGIYDAK